MAKGEKLITHTGGNRKIIINMQIAERELEKGQLKELNAVLIELNDIQETKLNK